MRPGGPLAYRVIFLDLCSPHRCGLIAVPPPLELVLMVITSQAQSAVYPHAVHALRLLLVEI